MKKVIKYLGLMICLMGIMGIQSCSSDSSSDARSLLETVPADADVVAIVNVEQMLTKAGCKVKGSKIELSSDLQKAIESMKDTATRRQIELITSGEAGVSPRAVCIFYGTRLFLTGHLEDPTAFKTYVEKETGSPFSQDNGANVNGNIAYIGNQFWIGMPGLPDGADLVRYTKLSEKQSMAGHKGADELVSMKEDISGFGFISTLLGTTGRNRAQVSMAMAALFENASLLGFQGNMKDKSIELEGKLLNADAKPAKFLLPTGKIDVSTVEKVGQKAESLLAAQIPSSLTEKVVKMFASFGGGLPESISAPLLEISGTSVVANGPEGVTALISTAKAPTSSLVELVGQLSGEVATVEGNSIVLNKGKQPGGALDIAAVAKEFKGAMVGFATDAQVIPNKDVKMTSVLTLVPEDGTLVVKSKIDLGPEGWKVLLQN